MLSVAPTILCTAVPSNFTLTHAFYASWGMQPSSPTTTTILSSVPPPLPCLSEGNGPAPADDQQSLLQATVGESELVGSDTEKYDHTWSYFCTGHTSVLQQKDHSEG